MPSYICEIARAIKKTGKTTSEAISIAVSRVKVWASGKGVDKDTQAKAVAALAEWEKKKAGAKADNVKATTVDFDMSDTDLLTIVATVPKCYTSALDQVLLSIEQR